MGDRLRSYALHVAARRSGASAYTLDVNQTLTATDIEEARRRLMMKRRNRHRVDMERLMEWYPFHHDRLTSGNNSRHVVEMYAKYVQYVVRFDKIESDLSALLGAFGCEEGYLSVNMHVLGKAKTMAKDELAAERLLRDCPVELQFGDWRHRILSERAETVNREGIAKVLGMLQAVRALVKQG